MEVKLMTERKNIVKALALLLATVMTVTMLPVKMGEVQAAVRHTPSPDSGNPGYCVCGAPVSDTSVHISSSGGGPSSSAAVVVEPTEEEKRAAEVARAQEALKQEDARRQAAEAQVRKEEAAKVAEAQKALDEAEKISEQNSQLTTGGSVLKTTVDGAYTARGVDGTVITTSQEQLAENFGLQEGQKLRVETWDVTKGNSPDAMRSMENAAKGLGGELGPVVQVNLVKTGPATRPRPNAALKAIVKAICNDKNGIGESLQAIFEGTNLDADTLAEYLSDKPEEQEFLAKYNEAEKEFVAKYASSENSGGWVPGGWYVSDEALKNLGGGENAEEPYTSRGLGDSGAAGAHLIQLLKGAEEYANAKKAEAEGQKGTAEMTVGVPKNFQSEGSTYSVAQVVSGGQTQILQDKDNNPNTVTFDVPEGEAAYGLVKKTNDTTAPEIEMIDYSKGSTVLGKAGLGLAKYMYDSVNEVATPEEKSLIDNMQKANDEYSALDTSGMNSAEVEDARDAIFQKYGFEDSSDAAEKVGDIMEKYNII